MKATFTATLILTTLAAFGGQALAADDAHEGYQRGIAGKRVQDDGAAALFAAKTAFVAPKGGTHVLSDTGVQAWEQPYDPAARVISGGVASAQDAHEGYRRGLAGKS